MLKSIKVLLDELGWVLRQRGELIVTLAYRMVFERHKGQVLGGIWAFFHPMLMISIYLVIFKYVFQIKFPESSGIKLDYTLYLLSGLVPWLAMVDNLAKAPHVLTSNASVIKQIHIPVEVFSMASGLSSLFYMAVYMALMILFSVYSFGGVNASLLLLPVVMLLNSMFLLGLTFILAPLSAYFKDLKELIQAFLLINMYMMPTIYPPGFAPPLMEKLLYLNPFSYFIWAYQDVFSFGFIRSYPVWGGMVAISVITFFVGLRFQSKIREMIADSL